MSLSHKVTAPSIPITNIIPPSLHLIQGLCQAIIEAIEAAEPSMVNQLEAVFVNCRWTNGYGTSVSQIYQKQKVAEIEPWSLLTIDENRQFEKEDNPNGELEWRNQAAAHTDCVLKYKEAAQFLIISDLDDLLIPQLGNTMIEELNILNLKYPKAGAFFYSRFSVNYKIAKSILSSAPARLSIADKLLLNTEQPIKLAEVTKVLGRTSSRDSALRSLWILDILSTLLVSRGY
uniref:Glycosyltransferase family 92 protein n=1 Tax=Ditylenchus dipsaci TaxID=166011 RepID=A0A915EG04_9BILA